MNQLAFEQKFLALIIVVGGVLVLASYALVPGYSPEVRSGLWGDVPDSLRPLYGISIFLGAAGFFVFTHQLIFRCRPQDFASAIGLPYEFLIGVYVLILVPSALWVPMTATLLEAPADFWWFVVRAVLAAVAVGSTLLVVILSLLAVRQGGPRAWASVAAVVPFWFQSAILDGVVWPYYFPFS